MYNLDYLSAETIAIDIDFTILASAEEYQLVNANLLFEFTPDGLVVPTRKDMLPFRFSAFS